MSDVTIARVVEETEEVRSLHFDRRFDAEPGQFAMVWIRGVDDVPMSFASESSIAVERRGEATAALHRLRRGSRVGIRGPLGRPFKMRGGRLLLIAGGIGAAPLAFLAERAVGREVTTLLGARTSARLLFERRFGRAGELRVATDDGSAGHRGFVTELLAERLLRRAGAIYTCGPEPMMARVAEACRAAGALRKLQLCAERYMKCGIGICGSCDLAGLRVCAEGPVFMGDELEGTEFGVFSRDASGKRVYFRSLK